MMIPLASLFPPALTILCLLFASSPPPPSPNGDSNNGVGQDGITSKMSPVIEARDKASSLTLKGKNKEAVMWYEDAIWLGRRIVLDGTKNDGSMDQSDREGDVALEMLVELYASSAWNRLAIPDIDGARREAWAACVHSQNIAGDDNVEINAARTIKAGAHIVLAAVCRAGDDPIGEKEALRNLLQLLAEGDDWDSVVGDGTTDEVTKSADSVKTRIDELEDELQKRYGGRGQ